MDDPIVANPGHAYAMTIVPHTDGGWALPGGGRTMSPVEARNFAERLSADMRKTISTRGTGGKQ